MAKERLAFFSMEYGVKDEIPIYSGGLGILAGDEMKSASDLGIDGFGVGLLYRRGYFRQEINNGKQIEHYDPYPPERHMTLLDTIVEVPIEGETVKVRPWVLEITGRRGNKFPIYLLDTDMEGNKEEHRRGSWFLYGADSHYRLLQEAVLGIGGVKLIKALGLNPTIYHKNEGHAALINAERLEQGEPLDRVIANTIFTTHTPVPAGHDRFPKQLFDKVLGKYFSPKTQEYIWELGGETLPDGQKLFNTTLFAFNTSRYRNAVSKLHGDVTREMFHREDIDHITNGVHLETWTSKPMQVLYDTHLPGWRDDPSVLAHARRIPKNELLAAQHRAKLDMLDEINANAILPGGKLDPHKLTIGFARRYATYKRGSLLFHNLDRLREVGKGKLQLVYAGKAHPQDGPGKEIIERVMHNAHQLGKDIPVAFLPNYSMRTGLLLTSGCDAWNNAPKRGFEASGTSGMKAAANGRGHCSMDDGWWCEAKDREGRVRGGWTFGDGRNIDDVDAQMLYNIIENEILPAYSDADRMAQIAYGAIENASYFNTHRSMKEYVTKAYGKRLEDFLVDEETGLSLPPAQMGAEARLVM